MAIQSVPLGPRDTRDDIWRAANLMLKCYGEKALEESEARADELAAADDTTA